MSKKVRRCILCGATLPIGSFGNNPEPLAHEGVCCDTCNRIKVVPARVNEMRQNAIRAQKENGK